jgi:hypothetical protein
MNIVILEMFPISRRKLRSCDNDDYNDDDDDEIQIEKDNESRNIAYGDCKISLDDNITLDNMDIFDNREAINNEENYDNDNDNDNMNLTLDYILKLEKNMSNQSAFPGSSIVPFSYTFIGKRIKQRFADGIDYIGEIINFQRY